jgi:tetratricopeptide (TPR) repeat protein
MMRGRSFISSLRTTAIQVAIAVLAILLPQICVKSAAAFEEQICDVTADTALGLENYPTTIALHRKLLQAHPDDALAHYHLGFAYGMTGRTPQEIDEYLRAVRLGLRQWDLFLDLGLAYFEQQDYANAIAALETAVALGPKHAEAHFNLALAYEKSSRLTDAMKEIVASLQLAPADPDMRNTKAIICAESGDLKCARDEWALLLRMDPDYTPARTNLAILMGTAPASSAPSANAVEIPRLVASESWRAVGR